MFVRAQTVFSFELRQVQAHIEMLSRQLRIDALDHKNTASGVEPIFLKFVFIVYLLNLLLLTCFSPCECAQISTPVRDRAAACEHFVLLCAVSPCWCVVLFVAIFSLDCLLFLCIQLLRTQNSTKTQSLFAGGYERCVWGAHFV